MFVGLQEEFFSNIVHLFNVGSMLGQRRSRWPSIKTVLDQCLVLKVVLVISSVAILMPSICTQWATVGLHLTVPGMRILQLSTSLLPSKKCIYFLSVGILHYLLDYTVSGYFWYLGVKKKVLD